MNIFPDFVDETRRLGVLLLRDEPPRTLREEGMHENYDDVDQSCEETKAVPANQPLC